jgi:hypothetical protein
VPSPAIGQRRTRWRGSNESCFYDLLTARMVEFASAAQLIVIPEDPLVRSARRRSPRQTAGGGRRGRVMPPNPAIRNRPPPHPRAGGRGDGRRTAGAGRAAGIAVRA